MLTLFKRTFGNSIVEKDNSDKLKLISDYKAIISSLKLMEQDSTIKNEIKKMEKLISDLESSLWKVFLVKH